MWRLDGNFDSRLNLKNVLLKQSLTVVPVLIMADGTRFPLPVVELSPAGVATINITDAMRHLPAGVNAHRSDRGMVSVQYAWSWGGAVLASVQNIDEFAMLSFHSALQADTARVSAEAQASLEQRVDATWWRPYASTQMFLFLGNSTDKTVEVTAHLKDDAGQLLKDFTTTLAPNASVTMDVFKAFPASPGVGSTGSVSIDYTGPPRGLVAYGGLEDQTNGSRPIST